MWSKNLGEAWCGTHIQRPALVKGSSKNLLELIQEDPKSILGLEISRNWGPELPFLFKILTISSPLSLQVHPNLNKALELSDRYPTTYLDRSEKPEIGVAIFETKLLLGFRPLEEIISILSHIPSAKLFFGETLNNPSLRLLYNQLLNANQSELFELNADTAKFFREKNILVEEEEQFLNLYSMYPSDSGVYQVFLLNFVTLKPGEGVFIPPDTIHAYLSGQLVECMAISDFVIRAGLTNKEKDIPSLLEVIDYNTFTVNKLIPKNYLFEFSSYLAPTDKFQLERFTGKCSCEVVCLNSPALYFCLRGSGQINCPDSTSRASVSFSPGSVCLVASGAKHLIALDGEFYRILV